MFCGILIQGDFVKLLLATSNEGKLREIRQIMEGYTILSLKDVSIDIDVEE